MAINPLKAFLFAGGGVAAVAGTAYVSGALDPLFQSVPPAQIAALEPADTAKAPGTTDRLPAKGTDAAATPAPEAQPPAPASNPPATAPAEQAVVPSFDVVRVEGNGSVVIAGNAAPKARVEALNGDTVLGSAKAGADGAFAIVLDTPLKPGDYQITLRSTTPDNVTATSQQTAVVSIPQKPDGQVLAMVEEPGKPSELLSMPAPAKQPEAPAEAASQPTGAAAKPEAKPATEAEAKAAEAAPAESKPAEAASAPAAVEATPAPAQPASPAAPAAGAKVVVEAVEIDGGKVFVAGIADAGRKVRAYANEILLGDAVTSPDGHFLVEASRDLPVGTYNVRVDALDADGAKVVARATVPFEREPGEAIAAVAPAEQPAQPVTAPEGENKPAEVAAATPPAGAVPETVAPKLEHADSAVIIRRHDTLWRISRRVYGHGIRYSTIYLANQDQISDPDRIWPGQVFKLPEKSREGEAADLTVLGDQMTTAPAKTE
ncbi:Ig-like domain-containing protein [Mesorhizobium sp. 8]|uniref:LysM peptidoglycan-binding domain-containing protein n=1 Tax=Mesorhizobium sp. 8 TaxID=2584466 RepID=UPI0011220C84|nr:Ig-like domain-containing protein [Mesorhizobium sp. 8]QDB98969.1 LysM peptidoglycan-binding domain-containing protein [Mesorhizobium sp. 8]